MTVERFLGGVLDTNGYLLKTDKGLMLVDAPAGVADWLQQRSQKVELLLLTHGHFDHVIDVARIQREHQCPIVAHPETRPMLEDRDLYRSLGMELEIEPAVLDRELQEGPTEFLGERFDALYVPGHCPGSFCFFHPATRILLGGDVIFQGAIGRWDLPGGDLELLLRGIHEKVLPLGDDVLIYPGHGPAIRLGDEKRTNPFLSAQLKIDDFIS